MAAKKTKKADSASLTHIDWNVPDWRDDSAYPKPDASMLPDEEVFLYDDRLIYWRWEFLRRRQDYREDFDTHAAPTYAYECAKAKAAPQEKEKTFVPPPEHPDFRANILYLPYANDPDWHGRVNEAMPRFKRYGLDGRGLPNPRCLRPTRLGFKSRYGGLLEGPIETRVELESDQVMITYCLSKPLAPQEQMVRKLLRMMQAHQYGKKVARRARPKEWPTYLRVLDARAAGVPYHVIGKVVLGYSGSENENAIRVQQDIYQPAYDLGINFPN